jgi:hypothetical protein
VTATSINDVSITSDPDFGDDAGLDDFDGDDGFDYFDAQSQANVEVGKVDRAPAPPATQTPPPATQTPQEPTDPTAPRHVTSGADVQALYAWATKQRRIALALAPDHHLAFGAADGTSWELDSNEVGLMSSALTAVVRSDTYLWAYDATALHRTLAEDVGFVVDGIRCAQTAWMTLHPVVGETRATLQPPGDSNEATGMAVAVAQLVESIHTEATPAMRQHILVDVKTDEMWRMPGLHGYAVDEVALEHEAQLVAAAQQRSVDRFGVDLTSDRLALAWMAEHGVTCTDAGEPTLSYKKLPDAEVPPGMAEEWAQFVALRDVSWLRNAVVGIQRKLRDGRAYPRINAVGAVTGRMSITGPAMQATPAEFRHIFHADPGSTLVACDFDRVEPCLVAAASADPGLLAGATSDIYVELAVSVWGESARGDAVRRAQAKTALNAITYGQGAASLARRLGLPLEDAQSIISGWTETYPQFHKWMKKVTAAAKNGDPLTTLTGRDLPTPAHPYQAVSYIIQGTAADIFKTAVLRVAAQLPPQFHLWLPIHDELVLTVPDDPASVEQAIEILAAEMETQINGVRITGTPVHLSSVWRKS